MPDRKARRHPLRPAGAALLGCALVAATTACPSPGGEPGAAVPSWRLSEAPIAVIGEVDGDAPYVLSEVAGVRLLEGGGVALTDGGSAQLRIFGPDGVVRSVMGGPGDGPGEFRWISALRYRPPDTLAVFDGASGRLTHFLADGSRAGEPLTFRVDEGYPEIYLGRLAGGAHILAWIRQETGAGERPALAADRMAIGAFFDGNDGPTVLAYTSGMRRIEVRSVDGGVLRVRRGPIPFSPHFAGGVVGDVVFFTDGAEPRIDGVGADQAALSATLLDVERLPFASAWERLLPLLDSTLVRSLEEALDYAGADSVPALSDLLVDDEQRLWVKEYDPATDSHWRGRRRDGGRWLVLTPEGTVVAHFFAPEGFRLMDVRGDLAAGVTRDDLDVQRVEVRRIER